MSLPHNFNINEILTVNSDECILILYKIVYSFIAFKILICILLTKPINLVRKPNSNKVLIKVQIRLHEFFFTFT